MIANTACATRSARTTSLESNARILPFCTRVLCASDRRYPFAYKYDLQALVNVRVAWEGMVWYGGQEGMLNTKTVETCVLE